MRGVWRPALALLAIPALSGCIAVLPLAAAGALGKSRLDERAERREAVRAARSNAVRAARRDALVTTSGPLLGVRIGDAAPLDLADEDAAPWTRMADLVVRDAALRSAGRGVTGAVVAEGSPLSGARFVPCEAKPLAVLVDLDGTGGSSGPLDPASVPGETTAAARRLHAAGAMVGWLSDRPAAQAPDVQAALTRAGLWSDGDRLLLADGRRKQERRWAAAREWCVVAQLGDTVTDMDELYDYLRTPEAAEPLDPLFGERWFLAPPTIQPTEAPL